MNALVQVGEDSDQTFQQYILKALGELAVYVDGMHGLIQCNEIIQWLYQLTESKVGGFIMTVWLVDDSRNMS